MSLGKRVQKLREERGMNQRQLAEACGLTQATISRIESGQVVQLKSEAMKRLARCLGVTTDFLTGNTDNMTSSELIEADKNAQYIFRGYEKLPEEGKQELKGFIDWLENKYREDKKNK